MLVIFDCDGVLVDSEVLAAAVFSEQLKKCDIHLTPEQCFRQFRGLTLQKCLQNLQADLPSGFISRIEVATQLAFAERLQPTSGIVAALQFLESNNIPFCVASNGGAKKVTHSLTVTGLLPYFPEHRFSAEMVAQGKPAPDLFLLAAETMGVPVELCVVIEDSPTGIQAAKAAGMKVLAFGPQEHGTQADSVFYSMKDLPPLLGLA